MLHVILSGSAAGPQRALQGGDSRCHFAKREHFSRVSRFCLASGSASAQSTQLYVHRTAGEGRRKSRRGLQSASSMRPKAAPPPSIWHASSPTTSMALRCWPLRTSQNRRWTSFDRGIALLPASTVKPDSLQWAVAFWHRATAYQQLEQWEQAAGDLATAEDTFTKGIAGAVGNAGLAQHLTQLRQRVRAAARGCPGPPGQTQRSAKPACYTIVLLTGSFVNATPVAHPA